MFCVYIQVTRAGRHVNLSLSTHGIHLSSRTFFSLLNKWALSKHAAFPVRPELKQEVFFPQVRSSIGVCYPVGWRLNQRCRLPRLSSAPLRLPSAPASGHEALWNNAGPLIGCVTGITGLIGDSLSYDPGSRVHSRFSHDSINQRVSLISRIPHYKITEFEQATDLGNEITLQKRNKKKKKMATC